MTVRFVILRIILQNSKMSNKKKISRFFRLFIIVFLCLGVIGCARRGPKVRRSFLMLNEGYLEKRQLQMRQYDTKDEEKIILAVAGVLQDLGFTLDKSESELGLVAASRDADATDKGQVARAVVSDILVGIMGGSSNASATVDAVQHVKASVIVKPSLEGNRTLVRVTFQRIVWNASNQINRVESINDPEIYQKFFDSLSKAIFLEAQKI